MKTLTQYTRYAITGWSDRKQKVEFVDHYSLHLVTIGEGYDFHGILTFDKRGCIVPEGSMLRDGDGVSKIMNGKFGMDRKEIVFVKKSYDPPVQLTIHASLHKGDCWCGNYEGDTAQGRVRFVLTPLPEGLFSEESLLKVGVSRRRVPPY